MTKNGVAVTAVAPPQFHTLKNDLGHLCNTYARTDDGSRFECLDGFTVPVRNMRKALDLALGAGESR